MKLKLYKVMFTIILILTFGIMGSIDIDMISIGAGAVAVTICSIALLLLCKGIEHEERKDIDR